MAADGSAYVTESFRGRIHRLRPGTTALEVWFTDAQVMNAVDGLAFLRVRRIERVRLHADLVMLGRLSLALSRARMAEIAA